MNDCLYHDLGIPDYMGVGCTCPKRMSKWGVIVVLICLFGIVWGIHNLINTPASQYDCLRHDCEDHGPGIPVGPM